MKKKTKVLVMSSLLVLFIAIASLVVYEMNNVPEEEQIVSVEEQTEGAVTYKLRKGVLTISGKGEIPKNMIFSENEEIEKVIIEEGITRIPKKAFYECINLKEVEIPNTIEKIGTHCFEETKIEKITIPESVKVIGDCAIAYCTGLKEVTMPGNFKQAGNSWTTNIMVGSNNIETVNFNTDFDVEIADRCAGRKWNVREEDPNYKSIGGVIYTKDGKEIVRVPKDLEVLDVAEGCEIFDFESIYYLTVEECADTEAHCDKLEKVILPKTINKIEKAEYIDEPIEINLQEVVVNTKLLDTENIITFVSCLKQAYKFGTSNNTYTFNKMDIIAKMFPEQIKKDNSFYIIDENILLGYEGNEEIVTVPKYIKTIADSVFYKKKCKKIILPEGLEVIKEKAFCKTKKLEEINLPSSLKALGSQAFSKSAINVIVIPSNITEWGEGIFEQSDLTRAILPNEMTVIPCSLFYWATELCNVNVPENLQKIEMSAFWGTQVHIQSFLDCKSLREIEFDAFGYVSWTELTIPEYITKIDSYAFAEYTDVNKKVTIKGANFEHFNETFMLYNNIVELTFEADPSLYFTEVEITAEGFYEDSDTNPTEIKWLKVNNVDGYDIVISSNRKFTKNVKELTAKKNQTSLTVDVSRKWKKVYVKIRPYKLVDGKKIYGKWTKDNEMVY